MYTMRSYRDYTAKFRYRDYIRIFWGRIGVIGLVDV